MAFNPEKAAQMLGTVEQKFGAPKSPDKTGEKPADGGHETTAKVIDLDRVRAALQARELRSTEDARVESALARVRAADAAAPLEKSAEISADAQKIRDLERATEKLQRALEDISADQRTLTREPAYFKNGPAAKSESGRKIQAEMKSSPNFDPKKGAETMSADAAKVQEEINLKKEEINFVKSQSQAQKPESPAIDQRFAA